MSLQLLQMKTPRLSLVGLCKEKFNVNLEERDVECCYRISQKKGPGVIFVRLSNSYMKQAIFSRKSQLKGTKIVIREDLTPMRLKLLDLAVKKFGLRNAWTSGGRIFCKSDGRVLKPSHEELLQMSTGLDK